jgi:hypothetical protein
LEYKSAKENPWQVIAQLTQKSARFVTCRKGALLCTFIGSSTAPARIATRPSEIAIVVAVHYFITLYLAGRPFSVLWHLAGNDRLLESNVTLKQNRGQTGIPFLRKSPTPGHYPPDFLNIVMFKGVVGQGQEDNSPQNLSPKLAINFVPPKSDLNTTAWDNFETAHYDLFGVTTALPPGPSAQHFQEYNLVNHVGTSQEATQNLGSIDPSNYYGVYAPQTWSTSTFGQPARSPSTYLPRWLSLMIVGNPPLSLASNREQDVPADFSVPHAAMTKREMRYEYYLILMLMIV